MWQVDQNFFTQLTVIELVTISVFTIVFTVRVVYIFLFTGCVLFQKKRNLKESPENAVSLILTVRNEEENIKNNLANVLDKKTENFEVIVVDDFSQDNTYLVLGLLKERYHNLKISTLYQETRNSVKLARNIAIKAASNNWIITLPVSLSGFSEKWISQFIDCATSSKNLIVGYSNIEYSKGIINHLFRIENFFQQIKSAGYICNGLPFVYTEENVAFRRKKYFETAGFGKKIVEPYANLELIINSFLTKKTSTILFEPDSVIRKNIEIKRTDFLDLIEKSFRIEKHLSFLKRVILHTEEATQLLFIPIIILSVILINVLWPLFIGLFIFWFTAHLLIIKTTQNHLNERKIFISSLVYDLLMPFFKLFYRWHFNIKTRKNRWRNKI